MRALFTVLLKLPSWAYGDARVRQCLQEIVGRHLSMRPLRTLAELFAAPLVSSERGDERRATTATATTLTTATATICRLRALTIATSYLQTLTADGQLGEGDESKSSSADSDYFLSAALTDAAAVLPHALSVLEHPTRRVRDAAVDFLAAVHATAPLPPLKGLTLRCSCTGSSSSSGGGSNSAASPSIAAVDLTALCGKIVAHRMEVSMDHRAVSNGLASWLLAGAGTGEAVAAVAAWEGSRKASLEFLLAQCVALGLSNFNFAPGGTAMDADDDEDG